MFLQDKISPSRVIAFGLPNNWFWWVGLVVCRGLIALRIVV